MESSGALHGSAWRWMFVVGALPAAMAVMVQRKVKEPALWLKAKAEGKITGGPFKAWAICFVIACGEECA